MATLPLLPLALSLSLPAPTLLTVPVCGPLRTAGLGLPFSHSSWAYRNTRVYPLEQNRRNTCVCQGTRTSPISDRTPLRCPMIMCPAPAKSASPLSSMSHNTSPSPSPSTSPVPSPSFPSPSPVPSRVLLAVATVRCRGFTPASAASYAGSSRPCC